MFSVRFLHWNKSCISIAIATLILAGCASSGSVNLRYESSKPLPEVLDTREYQNTFLAGDGKELGYVHYTTPGASSDIALVYLHGIESHAGWFKMAAEKLHERGYDVYCLDRRGSGINRENRGFTSGHIDSYQTLFADIRKFINSLHERYNRIVLVGLSWGGKLAMAYALKYPNDVAGVIMITPGIRAIVDKSALSKMGIITASIFNPKMAFKSPIKPEMFTTQEPYLSIIEEDPLRLRYVSASFFMQSKALDKFIDQHITQNSLPLQLFLASNDQIINNEATVTVLKQGALQDLDVVIYENQTHSIQFEAPDRLVADMDRWISKLAMVR